VEQFIVTILAGINQKHFGVSIMPRPARRTFSSFFSMIAVPLLCCACTRAELVSKADACDEAIYDSNNKQILLNAVRASQRAPMSFVGFGDMLASPSFAGAAGGTGNFSPAGLTSYTLNPAVAYTGGFSQFTINNLNHADFARQMQDPISEKLIQRFRDLKWPEEMVSLLLVHSLDMSKTEYAKLTRMVEAKCAAGDTPRTREICERLDEDRQEASVRGCSPVDTIEPRVTILNTGREFCSMNRFQALLRMLRLLGIKTTLARPRSPEGMLYYLGELIAAQNYSPQPYMPMTYVDAGGKRRLVKLFVVERCVSATAAVQVTFNGESFCIPRPQLGTVEEERSLQVLDLVSSAIVMATSKESLPKTNSISLVSVR
jgi:hypothetical protein